MYMPGPNSIPSMADGPRAPHEVTPSTESGINFLAPLCMLPKPKGKIFDISNWSQRTTWVQCASTAQRTLRNISLTRVLVYQVTQEWPDRGER